MNKAFRIERGSWKRIRKRHASRNKKKRSRSSIAGSRRRKGAGIEIGRYG